LEFFSRPIIHVSSTTFSDNERFVLTGAPPRNLYLWDLTTGKLHQKWTIPKIKIWKPTSAIVYATAISDDNSTIYAEASNGYGYVWAVKQ
jgi:WD40 repeat protein